MKCKCCENYTTKLHNHFMAGLVTGALCLAGFQYWLTTW